ncbi:hypothetical protein N657DRAFT_685702 [Parathielavia appendiculata]|uniref:Uncharacterized protein n=1 Tax=Parathielavia appendiculata TaxID=2587402 RepID=A0AAN6U8I4_9PEZI|nr:hypothetical protein N657DRAFT_685702 [Parathielavia appendiculata]
MNQNDTLGPFRFHVSGLDIPGFPRRVFQFNLLSDAEADGILRHLLQPTSGSIEEKRRRIKAHCAIPIRVSVTVGTSEA